MSLTFKNSPHTQPEPVDDPRRTLGGHDKPVTLILPGKAIKPKMNLASGTMGFFLLMTLAIFCLVDLKFGLWFIDDFLYRIIRLCTLGVVAVLVLLDAFGHNIMYGFLAFFPPFLVYYGFTMAESSVLRGMVIGLALWFALELLFIRPSSFLVVSQQQINKVIADGAHWLRTANR